MGREDQKEEREVLDSIFPDEIQGQLLYINPHIVLNKRLATVDKMPNF
jgi:hypothetical protein